MKARIINTQHYAAHPDSKEALNMFYNSLTKREKEITTLCVGWMMARIRAKKQGIDHLDISKEDFDDYNKMLGRFATSPHGWKAEVFNHILHTIKEQTEQEDTNGGDVNEEVQ